MKAEHIEENLRRLFIEALELYNNRLDSDITSENTVVVICPLSKCAEKYEKLCSAFFPEHLAEPYRSDGFFDDTGAMAFVGQHRYGILIRSDTQLSKQELFFTFLHELSHIFCTQNEIDGGHFFDKYCMTPGIEGEMLCSGHHIWREAVADIMADFICTDYALTPLHSIRNTLQNLYDTLDESNPASEKQMSLIIAQTMLAKEVAGTASWSEALAAIKREIPIADHMLWGILEIVFYNMHSPPFWTITPEFISDIGSMFSSLLSMKKLHDRLGR